MELSRRDFMKWGMGVAIGLTSLANANEPSRNKQEKKKEPWKYNDAQEEGTEEHNLREEISKTIGNTYVSYLRRPENSFELRTTKTSRLINDGGRLDNSIICVIRIGKDILEENLPIENLRQIRDYIRDFGPPLSSIYLGNKLIENHKNPYFLRKMPYGKRVLIC